jgi:hypothetical protein
MDRPGGAAGSWLSGIRDGLKRTFLPMSEPAQGPAPPDHDIEAGLDESEVTPDRSACLLTALQQSTSESSLVRSSETAPAFASEVGQWCESSPIKARTRASFDSYRDPSRRELAPRRSFAVPLPTVHLRGEVAPHGPMRDERGETKTPSQSQNPSISLDDDPGVGLDKYGNPTPLVVFKERWSVKEERIRSKSQVGHVPGYRLVPVIVKSNDDLRQEQCAGQLIEQIYAILLAGHVDCWLRPYGIIALSPSSGLIEAIPDTVSFDVLRRRMAECVDLKHFFEVFFGEEGTAAFEIARGNFIRSLATYCIVCYLLQIKDRHNGNILLDRFGHVIHIDFGFILGSTPGGNIGFESAPFKLTAEMVHLMGGVRSIHFHRFWSVLLVLPPVSDCSV